MTPHEIPQNGSVEPKNDKPFELHPSLKSEKMLEMENRVQEVNSTTSREELARVLEKWSVGVDVLMAHYEDGSTKLFTQEQIQGMVDTLRLPLSQNSESELGLTRDFGIRAKWNELVKGEQRSVIEGTRNFDELLLALPKICPLKGTDGGWVSLEDSTGVDGETHSGIESQIKGIRIIDQELADERSNLMLKKITRSCGLREKVKELLDLEHIDRVVSTLKS